MQAFNMSYKTVIARRLLGRRSNPKPEIASASLGKLPRNDRCQGFTYIEMLVVVSLLALCFVPLLQMFAQSMDEVSQYSDLGTALQLGREGMESVKNLRFTQEQIETQGTVWSPPEKDPPYDINGKQWRVERTVVSNTDPLEVHIEVFRQQNLSRSVIELTTLIEDL